MAPTGNGKQEGERERVKRKKKSAGCIKDERIRMLCARVNLYLKHVKWIFSTTTSFIETMDTLFSITTPCVRVCVCVLLAVAFSRAHQKQYSISKNLTSIDDV